MSARRYDRASSERIRELSVSFRVDGVPIKQQAHDMGMTVNELYQWRGMGAKARFVEKLWRMADYYGVSIDYLVGRE